MIADWSELARSGKLGSTIGRETEIEKLMTALLFPRRRIALLVGEQGVGKTAIVKRLAHRLAENPPEGLARSSVRYLSGRSILTDSPATILGHIEAVAGEAAADERTILVIDDLGLLLLLCPLHQEIAQVLRDALAAARFRCIASTTPEESRGLYRFPILQREFYPIEVIEPNFETAVSMLRCWNEDSDARLGVTIPDEAVLAAVDLTSRYISGCLPGKAIDCLRSAGIRKSDDCLGPSAQVTVRDITEEIARRTSIPISSLSESFDEKLGRLKDRLEARVDHRYAAVAGQGSPIDAVVQALQRSLRQPRRVNRPLGALLFWGPSGSGKTRLVEAIAECLFDERAALIRLEVEPEAYYRRTLFDHADCFSGEFLGVGKLTDPVRRRYPASSVVEFRHIERAHTDVQDLITSILDNGSVKERDGQTVSFRNTLFIFTVDVSKRPDRLDRLEIAYPKSFLKELLGPSFLGRLDGIIEFEG